MSELTATLHELAQICCDGEVFYRDAAARMHDERLRGVVMEVGRVRGELCRDFAEILHANGQPPASGGTLYGSLRKLYADIRAQFAGDSDRVYVDELEEAEDRLLHALEQSMLEIEPPEARSVLRRYMPAVRAAHERMRILKHDFTGKPDK